MADRIVQLQDKDGNNVYPISTIQDSDSAKITMTSTDPGEGVPLAANNFIAVYDSMGSLLDMFYPVGSYYETSDTSFDPNVSWGGTWVEDSVGRVTVAQNSGTFATVGSTGGSETYSHYHWQSGGTDTGSYYDLTDQAAAGEGLQSRIVTKDRVLFSNGGRATNAMRQTTTYSANTSSVQPYIVVKRWHRTA